MIEEWNKNRISIGGLGLVVGVAVEGGEAERKSVGSSIQSFAAGEITGHWGSNMA